MTPETVQHGTEDKKREAFDVFPVTVMLRPAPHRPRTWQSCAQLLLRRWSLALDDLRTNAAHQILGVLLHPVRPVRAPARLGTVSEDRAQDDLFFHQADVWRIDECVSRK